MCSRAESRSELKDSHSDLLSEDLREYSAPGPDGIPPKIIKELKNEIVKPLCILFRRSVDAGTIPEDWKKSHVTPVFKKGSKAEPGNYRPINLTSCVGKMLDRIAKEDIDDHIERNNLISKSQHGFRSGKSTESNLIEFLNVTTKWSDEGRRFDVIYLDFSKAFDVVCHERLQIKLKAIGIEGKMLEWLKDWMSGRSQRVGVDDVSRNG